MSKNKIDLPLVTPDNDRATYISRTEAAAKHSISDVVAKKLAGNLKPMAAVATGKVGRPTVLFAVADFAAAVVAHESEQAVLKAAKAAAASLATAVAPAPVELPPATEVVTAETAVEIAQDAPAAEIAQG